MIYKNMNLVAVPFIAVMISLMGFFSDRIKPVYQIAPAFALRSIVCFSFKFITSPSAPVTYVCSVLLLASSTMLIISIESLFMKKLSIEVRGSMTVLMQFFIGIGALFFHVIGGPAFDSIGPASPFIMVSCFDGVLFCFTIMLAALGMLTYGG